MPTNAVLKGGGLWRTTISPRRHEMFEWDAIFDNTAST